MDIHSCLFLFFFFATKILHRIFSTESFHEVLEPGQGMALFKDLMCPINSLPSTPAHQEKPRMTNRNYAVLCTQWFPVNCLWMFWPLKKEKKKSSSGRDRCTFNTLYLASVLRFNISHEQWRVQVTVFNKAVNMQTLSQLTNTAIRSRKNYNATGMLRFHVHRDFSVLREEDVVTQGRQVSIHNRYIIPNSPSNLIRYSHYIGFLHRH